MVAGAVANWYFTPYQDSGKKQRGTADGQLPRYVKPQLKRLVCQLELGAVRAAVRYSVWRAIRYHLGTIAFGSLIIAIVQFIRALVMYLEKTSKGKNNRIQKAVFAIVQCILKVCANWGLEQAASS